MSDHQTGSEREHQDHEPARVPDELLSMSQVRAGIGDVCSRVYYTGRPVGLNWHDETRVVMVPLKWWQEANAIIRQHDATPAEHEHQDHEPGKASV